MDSRIDWTVKTAIQISNQVLLANAEQTGTDKTEKETPSVPEIVSFGENEGDGEVHISLSRTFVLKYEQIATFVEDLKQVSQLPFCDDGNVMV